MWMTKLLEDLDLGIEVILDLALYFREIDRFNGDRATRTLDNQQVSLPTRLSGENAVMKRALQLSN